MKVFAVGTSCTWFERNNTSFIIDDKILFDTPSGSYKDILKRIDIFKLDAIIISHFHADHFGDFQVFATRIMRESEKQGRTEKLKVFGPKGILEKLVSVNKLLCGGEDVCSEDTFKRKIDFFEVADGDEFEVSGYKVKTYEVDHNKTYCLGFLFEDKNGKTIAFSGDTRECDGLHKMLEISDVAFVDMAAPAPAKAHLDCFRFVELQKMYPNCQMLPIHTSDECYRFAVENKMRVVNDFDEIVID